MKFIIFIIFIFINQSVANKYTDWFDYKYATLKIWYQYNETEYIDTIDLKIERLNDSLENYYLYSHNKAQATYINEKGVWSLDNDTLFFLSENPSYRYKIGNLARFKQFYAWDEYFEYCYPTKQYFDKGGRNVITGNSEDSHPLSNQKIN